MKNLIVLIVMVAMLFACSDKPMVDKTNTLEKFRLNNYDMILDSKIKYATIQFKVPSCFLKAYYRSTIRKNSVERITNTFNGYFSVEKFNESERNMPFVENEIMTSDALNLFHDAYVKARIQTLNTGISALKKSTPKSVKFPGVIQVVRDLEADHENDSYFVIATIKVKKTYYVFQWGTNKEILGYTYDDFEDILASVRKIK